MIKTTMAIDLGYAWSLTGEPALTDSLDLGAGSDVDSDDIGFVSDLGYTWSQNEAPAQMTDQQRVTLLNRVSDIRNTVMHCGIRLMTIGRNYDLTSRIPQAEDVMACLTQMQEVSKNLGDDDIVNVPSDIVQSYMAPIRFLVSGSLELMEKLTNEPKTLQVRLDISYGVELLSSIIMELDGVSKILDNDNSSSSSSSMIDLEHFDELSLSEGLRDRLRELNGLKLPSETIQPSETVAMSDVEQSMDPAEFLI